MYSLGTEQSKDWGKQLGENPEGHEQAKREGKGNKLLMLIALCKTQVACCVGKLGTPLKLQNAPEAVRQRPTWQIP